MNSSSVKLLVIFSLSAVLLFLHMSMRGFEMREFHQTSLVTQKKKNVPNSSVVGLKTLEISDQASVKKKSKSKNKIKYILQWSSPTNEPFTLMGSGEQGFIIRKCPHKNCFVTANRYYLGDYKKFDAVVFHSPEIVNAKKEDLPYKRSPHQKYVFGSMESSDNYPICSKLFDGFFNWTWTYKLNSDLLWGYIAIKNSSGNVIGPNTNMQWIQSEDMEPVSDNLKKTLASKTKTAAWFASNCNAGKRNELVRCLQEALQTNYGRTIDIYGKCGNLTCSRKIEHVCNRIIQNDYYFYLSFENSFSEDYVTEKLLRALQNNVIPIVYGGANYSRFMPDGSYINAGDQDVQELAAKMNELINDIDKYSEYFKWKKYYSYHGRDAAAETSDYCSLCAMLNDDEKVEKKTVYKKFSKWWNPFCKSIPEVTVYLMDTWSIMTFIYIFLIMFSIFLFYFFYLESNMTHIVFTFTL